MNRRQLALIVMLNALISLVITCSRLCGWSNAAARPGDAGRFSTPVAAPVIAPTFTASPPWPPPSPLSNPTAPAAAAFAGEDNIYVVQAGDSLLGIAKCVGVSMQAIMDANDLCNPDFIFCGQRLVIPRGESQPMATPAATATPAARRSPPAGAGHCGSHPLPAAVHSIAKPYRSPMTVIWQSISRDGDWKKKAARHTPLAMSRSFPAAASCSIRGRAPIRAWRYTGIRRRPSGRPAIRRGWSTRRARRSATGRAVTRRASPAAQDEAHKGSNHERRELWPKVAARTKTLLPSQERGRATVAAGTAAEPAAGGKQGSGPVRQRKARRRSTRASEATISARSRWPPRRMSSTSRRPTCSSIPIAHIRKCATATSFARTISRMSAGVSTTIRST